MEERVACAQKVACTIDILRCPTGKITIAQTFPSARLYIVRFIFKRHKSSQVTFITLELLELLLHFSDLNEGFI